MQEVQLHVSSSSGSDSPAASSGSDSPAASADPITALLVGVCGHGEYRDLGAGAHFGGHDRRRENLPMLRPVAQCPGAYRGTVQTVQSKILAHTFLLNRCALVAS